MIGDRDLLEFRQGYYELLGELLAREPSPALLARVAQGLPERIEAARALKADLAEGWAAIRDCLAGRPIAEAAEAAAEEFTLLFVGPREAQVQPYESYYLTGQLLDRPLVALRGFLKSLGLEKEPSSPEPEDFLAVELSVMARLIARQRAAPDPDGEAHWLGAQARFLKVHLLVWAPRCADDLVAAPEARFYRGAGRLLTGFLALEGELFRGWGPESVRTLEEARAAFGATAGWRGPLFDPATGSGTPARSRGAGGSPPPPARPPGG